MIVVVYPQLDGIGGIARYLNSFLTSLPEGQEVKVVTGTSFGGGAVDPDRIIEIPLSKNRLSLVSWAFKARKVVADLRRAHPGLVVNLHLPPLISLLAVPVGAPVVVTAHTTYLGMSGQFDGGAKFKSQWSALSVFMKKSVETFVFRQARKIIALTEQGKQEVERYGVTCPIAILPNGVDTQLFSKGEAVTQDIDLLFVGRIEKRKGSRPMVELIEHLLARRPELSIYIVGYGDDEDFVRESLAKYASVVMTGAVKPDEVRRYMARSRVYASTSYYEGLPGTCLEAMAMGVPAIVWDLLFYRGLVIPGENGQVVALDDTEAFALAIERMLADEPARIAMGQAGRAHIEANYDWASLAKAVAREIETAK